MGFSVSWKTLLGAILTPWPWGFPTQWGTRGIPHRLADYFIFPPALSPLSPAQVVNTSTMAGESWGVDTCLGCKVPRCPLGWGLASHTYHSPWLASQQGFSGPSPGTAGQGMGDRHIPQRGQSAVPLQSICQCLGPLGSNGVTAEASGGNPVLRAAGATEVKLTFMSVLGKNLLGFRTSCLVKLGQRDYLRGQGRRSPRWPHVIWRRKTDMLDWGAQAQYRGGAPPPGLGRCPKRAPHQPRRSCDCRLSCPPNPPGRVWPRGPPRTPHKLSLSQW